MFFAGDNGFVIQFENGYQVSVQFGNLNYCSNLWKEENDLKSCKNAEVAIFDKNSNVVCRNKEIGTPYQSHVTPEELVNILNEVKAYV